MLAALALPARAAEVSHRVLLQSSPVAGFSFHEGRSRWKEMRLGDPLGLVREPGNPHDPDAVRVEWRGIHIGYVPREENARVARFLDQGGSAEARISRLRKSRSPRERVELEIYLSE